MNEEKIPTVQGLTSETAEGWQGLPFRSVCSERLRIETKLRGNAEVLRRLQSADASEEVLEWVRHRIDRCLDELKGLDS